jgi:type I restriction-modification system DNA methylase subunit
MTIKQLISQWRLFYRKLPPAHALEKVLTYFEKDNPNGVEMFEQFLEQLAHETDILNHSTPLPLVNILMGVLQPQHGQTFYLTNIETGSFLIAANDYANTIQSDELQPISTPLKLYAATSNQLADFAVNLSTLDQLTFSEQIPDAVDFIVGNYIDYWKQIPFEQFLNKKTSCKIVLIIPDDWLFEPHTKIQRKDIFMHFNCQCLLRLPEGTFYGKDCSANVLFLETKNTSQHREQIWFYDLRTGISWLENTNQLIPHLSSFSSVYENLHKFKDKDQRLKLVSSNVLQSDWDYWWLDENDFIKKPISSKSRFFQDAIDDLYSLNNLFKNLT